MHFVVSFLLCVLSVCSLSARAEEKCGAEVKLLLRPSEVRSAVRSFKAGRSVKGEVYFFDTPSLDLLLQGIIVRVRHGTTNDLTVKMRSSTDKEIRGVSAGNAGFKCEFDWTEATVVRSYSIRTQLNSAVPQNGEEMFAVLSSAQKDLLEQVHTLINWKRIKRIADIKSTGWEIYSQPPFQKLMLELWEWPTGSVFELSTKVKDDSARTAYAELQHLAAGKNLSPLAKQTSKTAVALGDIAHVMVH